MADEWDPAATSRSLSWDFPTGTLISVNPPTLKLVSGPLYGVYGLKKCALRWPSRFYNAVTALKWEITSNEVQLSSHSVPFLNHVAAVLGRKLVTSWKDH